MHVFRIGVFFFFFFFFCYIRIFCRFLFQWLIPPYRWNLKFIYCISGRGVRHPKKRCPGYDTNLHLMVRLQFWSFSEMWRSPIAIIPRLILTLSFSTCYGPIYGLHRSAWKLLVSDRNIWYHITVQIAAYKSTFLNLKKNLNKTRLDLYSKTKIKTFTMSWPLCNKDLDFNLAV